jgi:hypothetical protein
MTQLLLKNSWEKNYFPKLSEKKEYEKLVKKPEDLGKMLAVKTLEKIKFS